MEQDIKIYYSRKEKKERIETFMQRILFASSMEDAIQAYLDMKTCNSQVWLEEYLNRPVVSNGKIIKVKDLPILKKVKKEAKKYVIANFEVIMGVTENELGQKIFLTTTKKELLHGNTDREVKETFYQKKEIYQTINQAINNADFKTLENFYSYIETDPCYKWVINYFKLQKPVQLERKQ